MVMMASSGKLLSPSMEKEKPPFLHGQKRDEEFNDAGWSDIAKWIQITSGIALFLMSLYQSGQYLVKYLSHPTVTSITWQPFKVVDTPAITICARPSYNPSKWADFFGKQYQGDEFLDRPYIGSPTIAKLAARNASFETFLGYVGIPTVTQVTYCALGSTDVDCDPYTNVWSSVYNWEKEDWSKPKETPSGQWVTRLVEEYVGPYNENYVKCGTLLPNVTIMPGLQQQIIIDLDSGYQQPPWNRLPSWRWTNWLNASYVIPSWNVYIHDRNDVLPAYVLAGQLKAIRVEHSRVTVTGFDTDRYSFISRKEDPCNEDPDYSLQRACFEQFILPCTLPGVPQENVSQIANLAAMTGNGVPGARNTTRKPVCNMAMGGDFKAYDGVIGYLFTKNGSAFFEETMRKCCQKKCVQYKYRAEVLSETPLGSNPQVDSYKAKLLIGTNSATLRAIDEQEAYDLDQFLGELGGAWGLFLGASLVNVIALLYTMSHRALLYYWSRRENEHFPTESP